MKLNWLLLFVCIFISSCSTTMPYQFVNKEYTPGSEKGILLCSVKSVSYGTLIGMPSPRYFFRKIDDPKNVNFQTWSTSKGRIEKGEYGYLGIYELPTGKYEMYHWNLFFNLGLIQYDKQPDQEFSLPFEIKSDCINYIGEFIVKDYIMSITDESDRDVKLAIEQAPSLANLPVISHEMNCVSGCSSQVKMANGFFYIPYIPVIP